MSPGHEPAAQPEIIASDVGAQEEGLERGCIAGEEGAWESDSATLCGHGFQCAGDVMHTHTHIHARHSQLHTTLPRYAEGSARWRALASRWNMYGSAPVVVCAVAAHSLFVGCCLRRRGTLLICFLSSSAPSRHTLCRRRCLRRRGTLLICLS